MYQSGIQRSESLRRGYRTWGVAYSISEAIKLIASSTVVKTCYMSRINAYLSVSISIFQCFLHVWWIIRDLKDSASFSTVIQNTAKSYRNLFNSNSNLRHLICMFTSFYSNIFAFFFLLLYLYFRYIFHIFYT